MSTSGNVKNAVITGIGVVAPTGIGLEAHWQAVLSGKSGLGRISRFDPAPYPVQLAGQVPGFVARDHVPGRLLPQMDVWTHMSIAAADAALADAGVNPATLPEYEMAVVTASSSGGTEFGQHEMVRLYQQGASRVGAYQSIAWFYAATTGQLSIRHGMRGPCGVVCNEQAGGLDSVGQARRLTRSGTRLVVAGGLDASLCPYGLTAQLSNGLLSTVDDPCQAYLPFDVSASGYLPGEGGAILLVEDQATVEDRESPAYGRVAGYASGFDPPPGSPRPPALARVIRAALDDARIGPGDVDVVFADGLGVPAGDLAEARAITEVFGPRAVAVTAPKTLTGRLYAGGGALDVATALLAMRHNVVPHTTGPTRLAPGCDIDLVLGEPRNRRVHTALVLARGYGGFASAVVLQRTLTATSRPRCRSVPHRIQRTETVAMPDHFTLHDLTEILRTSIGIDDGVQLDGKLADVDFTEIGYDSLALIELASQLEQRYDVRISDEDALEKLRTPCQAVEYVNDQLATRAA